MGKDISFPQSVDLIEISFLSNYTAFENLKLLAAIKGRLDDDKKAIMMRIIPGRKKVFVGDETKIRYSLRYNGAS